MKNRLRLNTFWAGFAAALSFNAEALSDQHELSSGSLYPSQTIHETPTALSASLGNAAFILQDLGGEDEFKRQVRRAIGAHPVFHAQVAQRKQTQQGARAERAALYPQLAASLTGDYVIAREFNTGTDNVVESLQPGGRLNAGLSVSQLLFDGGASFQRIKAAKARDRQNQQSINARINDLALSALSAYHDLAIHRAIYALGQQFIRDHISLLNDVKERNRLGAGTRADVYRAEARLAAAQARVAQIKESMRIAEVRFEEFYPPQEEELRRPSLVVAGAHSSRDAIVAQAIEVHPEVLAAKARTEESRATFKATRAQRMPELRASVNAVKFDLLEGDQDFDVRAGVNVNYNLFGGGARSAAIAQAREAARQQQFEASQIRDDIARNAAIAFEQHNASEEKLDALQAAVIAHYKAKKLVAERFKAARGDLIDVLQAENDYFEAGVAFLAGVAELDMATYNLMEHSGELLRHFSPQNTQDEAGLLNE